MRVRFGMVAALLLSAGALAGCGQNDSNTFKASFDNGFNQAFDKSTHDGCVPSAIAHGATSDQAEKYCTCVVGELDKLTVQEKENLNQTPDKLTAAAATCNAQISAGSSGGNTAQ